MPVNPYDPPRGEPNREHYYDCALIEITLICRNCSACLDPDDDLGPNHNFESDYYFILLGDEAFRRGWLVEDLGKEYLILCPSCSGRNPTS
jgi:hypothetical protein